MSCIHVFLEGIGERDGVVEATFLKFGDIHADSDVWILKPNHGDVYTQERRRFGITDLPAFVVESVGTPAKRPLRLIFQQGFFAGDYYRNSSELLDRISSLHNLCADGLLDDARRQELTDKLVKVLGRVLDEAKGVVSIGLN